MTESGPSTYARGIIESLRLSPHPEGGWYRRTWQSGIAANADHAAAAGADMGEHSTNVRPLASLIYFLLPAGEASDWHVVDADEAWLWHGPGAVTLELGGSGVAPDKEHAVRAILDVNADGAQGHLVVPAGVWQRTVPSDEDALVSCMVCPGFVYSGFTLAAE